MFRNEDVICILQKASRYEREAFFISSIQILYETVTTIQEYWHYGTCGCR